MKKPKKQTMLVPAVSQQASIGPAVRLLQPEQMPLAYEQPKTAKQALGVQEIFERATGKRRFTGVPCYRCHKRFTLDVNGVILKDINCPECNHAAILKKDLE